MESKTELERIVKTNVEQLKEEFSKL